MCEIEVNVFKPVEDITGIPQKISLNIGANKKIQYKLLPEDIKEKANFVSEDESIVSVTRDGIVEALAVGKTNVIISVHDYSECIEITVIENKQNENKGKNPPKKTEVNDSDKRPLEPVKEPKTEESLDTKETQKTQESQGTREESGSNREIVQDDTAN